MNFLALNDDGKFIFSKHLDSDLKIRAMLSKKHDLQQILFGDVVYTSDDDLCKYLNLQYNAKENDDFKNSKIFRFTKIFQTQKISYVLVVLVIH